ncbi:hypothetical protein [Dongia sp.]|uniref:hypothetical protein n=1 Tax=Dongia sp. TaxID=1977262 RepID=UPI0035B4D57E
MLKRMHPIAGCLGFAIILTFWLSTLGTELFGTVAAIVAVKITIPWGFILLVPALAFTGASGARMAGKSGDARIAAKQSRMKIIAANGLLVLMPAAFYLAHLAAQLQFGGVFYAVQAVELLAGAVNLSLMALNMRDGLRLAGRV